MVHVFLIHTFIPLSFEQKFVRWMTINLYFEAAKFSSFIQSSVKHCLVQIFSRGSVWFSTKNSDLNIRFEFFSCILVNLNQDKSQNIYWKIFFFKFPLHVLVVLALRYRINVKLLFNSKSLVIYFLITVDFFKFA